MAKDSARFTIWHAPALSFSIPRGLVFSKHLPSFDDQPFNPPECLATWHSLLPANHNPRPSQGMQPRLVVTGPFCSGEGALISLSRRSILYSCHHVAGICYLPFGQGHVIGVVALRLWDPGEHTDPQRYERQNTTGQPWRASGDAVGFAVTQNWLKVTSEKRKA